MTGPAAEIRPEAQATPAAAGSARARLVGVTGGVWALAAAPALSGEPRAVAMGGAFAIGWSHLVGRCGISHLGTMTPRGKIPGQRRYWLVQVLVYVAAGVVASAAVGMGLAAIGGLVIPDSIRDAALGVVILVAGVAAASELGLIRWRLPEPNRQTRQAWGYTFRRPVAAALWGFGLGLTFATVFTFSGVWLVLTLPSALGEAGFGAALLVTHWLGRAVSILAGPVLLHSPAYTNELLDEIEESRTVFRITNIAGIVLMAAALVGLLLEGV